MLSASLTFLITILLPFLASTHSLNLVARQDCPNNYSKCSPPGATATNTASIGGGLSSLYVNILNSIGGVKVKARGVEGLPEGLQPRASSNSVCCKLRKIYCTHQRVANERLGVSGTLCLLVHDLNLPFCYVSNTASELTRDFD